MLSFRDNEEQLKKIVSFAIKLDPMLGRLDMRHAIRAFQRRWYGIGIAALAKLLFKYLYLKCSIIVGTARLESPIFIVGMPHSGTTLLAKLLGRSKELINLSEYNELFYPKGDYLVTNSNDSYHSMKDPRIERAIIDSALDMYRAYHKGHKRRVINKSPMNIVNYRYLRAVYPDCKIICIVRNPLAFARSSMINVQKQEAIDRKLNIAERVDKMPGPKTAANLTCLNNDIQKQFLCQWNSCNSKILTESLSDDEIAFIDYADLVNDGKKIMNKLTNWLGIQQIDISEITLYNSDLKHLEKMKEYEYYFKNLENIKWYVEDWNSNDKRIRA